MTVIPALSLVALAAIVAAGSYLDARYRLLPNWLCGIALVLGLVLGAAGHGWQWMAFSALHAALALLVGMGLFAAGIIGGGDAKYYAALAAWFPIEQAPLLLLLVSIPGFFLSLALWLVLRWRQGSAIPADSPFRKVPYGVAIGIGALLALAIGAIRG